MQMEDFVGRDFECARRALAARDGQDDETRLALERCAGKFALKALGLLEEPVEQVGRDARYAGISPVTRT